MAQRRRKLLRRMVWYLPAVCLAVVGGFHRVFIARSDQPPGTAGEAVSAVEPRSERSADGTDSVTLTVMTYNIRHGEGTDDRVDLQRIADAIRDASADIVALQEVDRNTRRSERVDQLGELARLTGMTGYFGKARRHFAGEYGNGILSRFPIERVSNTALPGGFARGRRAVLTAKIAIPAPDGGDPLDLYFLSTHLDFAPVTGPRLESVEKIRGLVGAFGNAPCLLAGDMNAQPGGETIEALQRDWSRAHPPTALPTYPAETPVRTIDHVFYRPQDRWTVVDVAVPDSDVASDHRPVVVKLVLLPQERSGSGEIGNE